MRGRLGGVRSGTGDLVGERAAGAGGQVGQVTGWGRGWLQGWG